jgi:hypothetical protein
MTRRDPPRGVSPIVFAAALALGAALLLPSWTLGGDAAAAPACPPAADVAR